MTPVRSLYRELANAHRWGYLGGGKFPQKLFEFAYQVCCVADVTCPVPFGLPTGAESPFGGPIF